MNIIHWERSPEQQDEMDAHKHLKYSKSKYDYHAQQYGQITGNLDFSERDMEPNTNQN